MPAFKPLTMTTLMEKIAGYLGRQRIDQDEVNLFTVQLPARQLELQLTWQNASVLKQVF